MAHFYGVLQGSRGEVTRCGTKESYLETTAASWEGSIAVTLWHNDDDGHDYARVDLQPWRGHGTSRRLYYGRVDGKRGAS